MKREKIRVYIDESVDVRVAEGLKRRGIDAWSSKDAGKLGLTDEEQLKYAFEEKAIIFTHDDDFLGIAAKSNREHYGLIYVHQQKMSIGEYIRQIKNLVETKLVEEMRNRIVFL
ncbi:MAG: DUF5615 family PIN-like protein [Candidatus Aerophobetes bacterium]|nr:DUF5615 family PIN-like protein [Candidatus Aerophobetes bacterium]